MDKLSQCAVAGLGVTRQGKLPEETSLSIKSQALLEAMHDAGLRANQIDGFIICPGLVDTGVYGTGGEVVKRLGLAPNFVWEVQTGGASAIAAVTMACWAVQSGLANYVAIDYGDKARTQDVMVGAAGDVGGGDGVRDTAGTFGMYSPGADHALAARRHMHLFGTTKEQLGAVALSARRYANKRPDAYMHDRTLTMADYLGARQIAEPLSRFDYCLVADGGAAMIVTSLDRARALRPTPVVVKGMGASTPFRDVSDHTQFDHVGCAGARDRAFSMAGISVGDIDVAQIYDCFTITVLLALEGYGFCGKGEAGAFVADGNLHLDGQIPTNTAGGELAWSYLQGFIPLVEGLRQVRGESGPTQVKGAETALVTGQGGAASQMGNMDYVQSCMVLQADR